MFYRTTNLDLVVLNQLIALLSRRVSFKLCEYNPRFKDLPNTYSCGYTEAKAH